MQPKRLAFGLGIFSIALGVVELLAAKRIAETLDAPDHAGLVRGFGAREVLAGVNLIVAPAASVNMWNRVAGDALDLGTLALAAKRSPSNRAIWGAIAFVAGVTVVDALTARGVDGATGRFLPKRQARA
jgi:hypothetical protein